MPALKFFDGTTWNTVGGPGPIGPAGATGPAGPTGATGAWWTYVGTGTPPAGTFSGEKDGDMAARSSDSEVFKRVSGAWVDQGYAMGYAMQTAARAYRNAAFTTVAGWQKIPVDTVAYDAGSNLQIANGRYIVPVAGYYQVNVNVQSALGSGASINVGIGKNGSFVSIGTSETISGPAAISGSDIIQCNAGDILELWCYTNGAYALSLGAYANYFSVAKVDVGGRPGTAWNHYNGTGIPNLTAKNGDYCVRTSDGEIFTMSSGAWIDQGWSLQGAQMNALYAARAYRNAAFSVASGWNKVPIDRVSFDPVGGFVTVGGLGRYICPVAGTYHVDGNITANTSVAGLFLVSVYKNGASCTSGGGNPVVPASATETNVNVSDIVQCNAGDYLELWSYSSAGSVPLYVGSTNNYLSVTLVSASTIQQQALQPASQARMWMTNTITLGAIGGQKVPLDTISYDAGNNLDMNNRRYVCPAAGYYQVEGQLTAQSFTGTLQAYVRKNGGQTVALGTVVNTTAAAISAVVSDVVKCNAGDYLELWGMTNVSAGLNVGLESQNYLSVTLVGTVPTSAPAHACKAYSSTAPTIPASTWTKVPLDSVVFDPGGNFQTAARRYVCPVTGIYDVIASVCMNESATGTYTYLLSAVYKNGTAVSEISTFNALQSYGQAIVPDKIQCNAGDYLELYVYNSQATALSNSQVVTFLSVSLLTGSQIGPQGASGPRGTQWFIYNGSGTPAPGSFAGELDGDWAIRQIDGENFRRVSGAWVDQSFTNRSTAAVTAAKARRGSALSMAAGWNKVPMDTLVFDSIGTIASTAQGRFNIPQTGYYQISGQAGEYGNVEMLVEVVVNGSIDTATAMRGTRTLQSGLNNGVVSGLLLLNAGDYIELYVYAPSATSLSATPGSTWMTAVLIAAGPGPQGPAGPQGIPGNSVDAKTAARAYRAAALTTAAAAFSKIPVDTLSWDSGTNMQIANGRYVVPVSGYYQANGEVAVTGNPSTDCLVHADLYVNGALAVVGSVVGRMDASGYARPNVSDVLRLNAGDYVELWTYTSAAFALFVGGASSYNYLSLVKVDVGGPVGPQGPQGIPGGVGNTAARAYRAAGLSTTANTWIKVAVDTVNSDPGGHIANGGYVAPSDGWYSVRAMGTPIANAAGQWALSALYKNGAAWVYGTMTNMGVVNGGMGSLVADMLYLAAGDRIELWLTSNASVSVSTGTTATYLAVVKTDQSGPQGPPGGAANQVASAYSIVQGYAADRSFSPALTSLGEVANVLATLIDDMKNAGLIRP